MTKKDEIKAEVRLRFAYHPPRDGKDEKAHARVEDACLACADSLVDNLVGAEVDPDDLEVVLDALQLVRFRANAALALHRARHSGK